MRLEKKATFKFPNSAKGTQGNKNESWLQRDAEDSQSVN